MKRNKATWTSGLALLFIMTSAHAQLYKWVAPDGTISYSDTPPPASATGVERKSYDSGPSLAGLPYELSEAAKGNPVVLYTMPNCAGCDAGRKLLNDRGIPYTEKTVTSNEDIARVRQLTGNSQMPVLMVGRSQQTGFQSDQWGSALTAAGYPATSQLPKDYSNPAPEPAAPSSKTAENQSNTDVPNNTGTTGQSGVVTPPPPAGNAPPGFQF